MQLAHALDKNRKCAGPNTFSKQCSSSYKDAAPKCCLNHICRHKRCVSEEPQLIVPQEACDRTEISLHFLFKSDSHAKLQNKINIEEINTSGSKLIKTLKGFPNDYLFVYSICLKQSNCYALKITDEKTMAFVVIMAMVGMMYFGEVRLFYVFHHLVFEHRFISCQCFAFIRTNFIIFR